MTLRIKILLLISFIIIGSQMLNIAVSTHFIQKYQKEQKKKDISRIASHLQRDIESAMLSGRPESINSIIENYSKMDSILSLRVLDEKGMILKSFRTAEIGLKSADYLRFQTISNDKLYYTRPIESSPSCRTCHGEKKILGIIEMKYDLGDVIFGIKGLKRLWAMSGILVFITGLIVSTVLLSWLLFNPLKRVLLMLKDPELVGSPLKEKEDEIESLSCRIKELIHKFKNLTASHRRLQEDIFALKTEMKYKDKLEEINRELQHSLKELESTNKALHLVSQETKKRLNLMEINLGRLKKTGDITLNICDKKEKEEVIKIFIKYITDIVLGERGIIYIKKNSSDFLFHYIRNYGFTPEISREDKNLLSKTIKNGGPILDIHPVTGKQVIGIPVRLRESLIGGLLIESAQGESFSQHDIETITVFSNHLSVAFKNIQSFEIFTKSYTSVVEALIGDILEENKFYRKGRSRRLKRLSVELGKKFSLSSKELETLEQASALSDIGKLRIPYRIFNKKGPLTPEEFNILKMHPIKGAELFDGLIFHDLKTVILQHHERYDGKGYPDGIEGEDIDIKARIICLVDAFEAMLSDRPYRPALSLENTLKEIENTSGRQFDPEVVKRFFDIINENPHILVETGYRTPEV